MSTGRFLIIFDLGLQVHMFVILLVFFGDGLRFLLLVLELSGIDAAPCHWKIRTILGSIQVFGRRIRNRWLREVAWNGMIWMWRPNLVMRAVA